MTHPPFPRHSGQSLSSFVDHAVEVVSAQLVARQDRINDRVAQDIGQRRCGRSLGIKPHQWMAIFKIGAAPSSGPVTSSLLTWSNFVALCEYLAVPERHPWQNPRRPSRSIAKSDNTTAALDRPRAQICLPAANYEFTAQRLGG
jgi:hypothetical protein